MLTLNAQGMLDPSDVPHAATLEEIELLFVDAAPFSDRRRLIFRALTLYADLVWSEFPAAKLWINGGFTTHKSWEAPEDADIATILPVADMSRAFTDDKLPLSTLQRVISSNPPVQTTKLHPFGGLLDTFFVPDLPARTAYWHHMWSLVRGPDRETIEGQHKGFVEVVRP